MHGVEVVVSTPIERAIHPSCLAVLPPHLCGRLCRLVTDPAAAFFSYLEALVTLGRRLAQEPAP